MSARSVSQRRRFQVLLAIVACLVATLACAEPVWMRVVLDGRKIGSLETTRGVHDGIVETTQTLHVRFNRGDTPLNLANHISSRETLAGQPLGFDVQLDLSAVTTTVHGARQPDGAFRVTRSVAGQNQLDTIAWPTDAVLFEGQRLAMQRAAADPGQAVRLRFYDPASGRVATSKMVALGREAVDLPEGNPILLHLRQTLLLSTNRQIMDLWVDDDFRIRKGTTTLLGYQMTMLACSRACAEAPYQGVDLLRHSMTPSPRKYTRDMLRHGVEFLLRIDGDNDAAFVATGEQRALRVGPGLWRINVGRARRDSEAPPTPADTAATPWLQSTHPDIVAAARSAVGSATTPRRQMPKLKEFVHHHLEDTGLDVGYASALEALQQRRGDCTEHAVLLTAMARALGIPARTVTGIVYASRYAGANRVFVPHMWMQAWIDGRWQSYDAAVGQFDSSHIAFGIGDGDPWRYFATLDVLAHLHIDRITPDASLLDTMPMAAPAPEPTAPAGAG